MEYSQWRSDLFDHGPPYDPCVVELSDELDSVSLEETFDYLDRMLIDPELHILYSPTQLALGLSMAFNNCFTNFPFCYLRIGTEDRRIYGILNLKNLYDNFFGKYCLDPYPSKSHSGSMQHLCENFWERFILFPGEPTSVRMVHAGLDVMEYALSCRNDHCVASALSGIASWTYACRQSEYGISRPMELIRAWVETSSTRNPSLVHYGRQMLENVTVG